MMKNAMVLFCICLMLMVCKSNVDSVDTPPYEGPPYEGRSLVIGLIGENPNIREENVDFVEVAFKQLEEEELSSDLDAIFITKEFLVEASNPQYAKVYHHSDIPFSISSLRNHTSPLQLRSYRMPMFLIFQLTLMPRVTMARNLITGNMGYPTMYAMSPISRMSIPESLQRLNRCSYEGA